MSTSPSSRAPSFKNRIFQTTLIVVAVTVVTICIWYASDVLLVLFAGILVAIFLRGLGHTLSRLTGFREGWSLAIVFLTLVGVMALGFWLLAPEVSRQIDELSRSLPDSMAKLHRHLDQTGWGQWLVSQFSETDQWMSRRRALSEATTILSTTIGAFAGAVIMLAVGLYLAAQPKFYLDGAVRLVPPARRERAREVLLSVGETLHWWLIGKIIGMVLIGVLTWIGLLSLNVPLALTLALIAALLTFIPNIGPILAVVPAALLAAVDSPVRALYVLLLYFGIQTVESYLVTPLIQRRTIRMPPALTIAAQLLFGAMLGLLGVALATPLAAALLVFIRELYVKDIIEKPPETSEVA
ncbi:MAG: AI-2E family transporter [Phycisphaerae bacterium]|mgnify:CR=1 FL=1|nr:AI-2E family transporter [Phycisphaerae bacterium]